jgi:hypothetical protein
MNLPKKSRDGILIALFRQVLVHSATQLRVVPETGGFFEEISDFALFLVVIL